MPRRRTASGSPARVGVADGGFAAMLAAMRPSPAAYVVPPGESPGFSPWPVAVLEDRTRRSRGLADLLVRLGLRTLGSVRGAARRRRARSHRVGRCAWPGAAATTKPRPHRRTALELIETAELDPPRSGVETLRCGQGSRRASRHRLGRSVCSHVRMIEAETERGERLTRCWRHEGAHPGGVGRASALAARGLAHAKLADDDHRRRARDQRSRAAAAGARRGAARHRSPARVLGRRPGRGRPRRASSPGCRGCSAILWSRPCPKAGARRASGCGGCRGAILANRPDPSAVAAPGAKAREVPPWPSAIPAPAPARLRSTAPGRAARRRRRGRHRVGTRRPLCAAGALRCGAAGPRGEITAWAGPGRTTPAGGTGGRRRRAYWQVLVAAPYGERVACLVAVTAGDAALEAIYD